MLNLPKHLGLSIEHNEHKMYYQTVQQTVDESTNMFWVPGDSRQRAIDSDDMWCVQWYPDTPVGFNRVYGHTLEEILDFITKKKK